MMLRFLCFLMAIAAASARIALQTESVDNELKNAERELQEGFYDYEGNSIGDVIDYFSYNYGDYYEGKGKGGDYGGKKGGKKGGYDSYEYEDYYEGKGKGGDYEGKKGGKKGGYSYEYEDYYEGKGKGGDYGKKGGYSYEYEDYYEGKGMGGGYGGKKGGYYTYDDYYQGKGKGGRYGGKKGGKKGGESSDDDSLCPVVDFVPYNGQLHNGPSLCGQTISEPVTLTGHLVCDSDSGPTVDAGGVLDCAGYTVKAGSLFGHAIEVQNGGKVENCRVEGGGDSPIESGIRIGAGDNKVTNCLVDGNVGGSVAFGFDVLGNGNSVLKCCKAQGVERDGFCFATETGGQTTVANSIAEDCGQNGFWLGIGGGVNILKGIEVNGSYFNAIVIDGSNNNLNRIKITHAGVAEAIDIRGSNNKITNLDIQVSGGVDGISFRSDSVPTNNVLKKMKIVAEGGGKCIVLNDTANQIKRLECTET